MPASDTTTALQELLAEYFSGPLAHVFVMTTLSRLDIDPSKLTPETMPRVVRLLADSLPAYMSDTRRREECMARLLALSPDGMAEPSRVAPLPIDPGATLPARRSRRPPSETTSVPAPKVTVVRVQSAEDVMRACDAVRELTRSIGFPQVVETKVATAVAELARNLQLYARGGGEVQVSVIGDPPRGVEVVTVDQGPGIPNLDHVLNGKYRSKTGMGMGLRGARRLMDTFDISTSPAGTRVVVRKYLA